jgi:hypothetical protein
MVAELSGGAAELADERERAGPRELASWQRLVLPVMVLAVVAAGVFFAVEIVMELRTLYPRLEQAPTTLTPHFERFEESQPEVSASLDYLRYKTLVLLESDALQRRYQQVNAAMLSRVWTRQMGFLTGMLMALIGSAFILGRLEVRETTLSAEGSAPGTAGLKGALGTSSPGIVLATLGAVLMGITITIPGQIATTDTPVYLRYELTRPSTETPPLAFPEIAEFPPEKTGILSEPPPPLPAADEEAGRPGAAAPK